MTQVKKHKPLECSLRDKSGKGAARSVRREGKVPAVLYNGKNQPVSIALDKNALVQEYTRGRFHSRIVELVLDGKTVRTLPQDLQFHPVTDQIEHVDFLKIEDGQKIRVSVPVVFRGSDRAVGVKRGGVLNIVRHEIEFICLPEAIPTHIEADVSEMDIGHSLHINSIKLPPGIEPTIKRNFTVATVAGRGKSMEEEETTTTTTATAEGAAAPGAEAGAAPAAGAAGAAAPGAAAPADGKKPAEGKKDEGKKDKK